MTLECPPPSMEFEILASERNQRMASRPQLLTATSLSALWCPAHISIRKQHSRPLFLSHPQHKQHQRGVQRQHTLQSRCTNSHLVQAPQQPPWQAIYRTPKTLSRVSTAVGKTENGQQRRKQTQNSQHTFTTLTGASRTAGRPTLAKKLQHNTEFTEYKIENMLCAKGKPAIRQSSPPHSTLST